MLVLQATGCKTPQVIFKLQTLQDWMDVGEVPETIYGLLESGQIKKRFSTS